MSSRVPPVSPSPTPSPASLLSCLPCAGRKRARGLSPSGLLREDAGTHMAAFLPLNCPLSSPPPYAALSLCWDFPVTPAWISRSLHLLPQLPQEFHISTARWVFPSSAALPATPSHALYSSEDLLRLYALGISSSSGISHSHYCALVREAWDVNSVFCLRHGMRNQENWLLPFLPQACQETSGKPGQTPFILCNFDKAYKYSLQDRRAFTSPSANAALDSFENPE